MSDVITEPKAKGAHIWERDEFDWYQEPTRATRALLRKERFNGMIWDPACGGGNIMQEVEAAGYFAVGTDIVQRTEATWFHGEADFLGWSESPLALNIVMNPPFYKAAGAEAFIRKALSLARGKVCAFVDIRFLAGGKRAEGLYKEFPPHRCWIITPRVSCPPGAYLAAGNKAGNGSSDWAWIVWDMTAPPSTGMVTNWLNVNEVLADSPS